jgi:hypothetical protein
VVEVDRCDHRDVAVGGVRRVPGAAHPDLDDRDVHRRVGEGDEGEHREQLEEGESGVAGCRELGVDEVDERLDLVPGIGDEASSIGSPSIMMRSVKRSRCGTREQPVRSPWARTIDSMMRLVEVLPFVPVTCTTR